MLISILTLFPEMFSSPFNYSIVKRAQDNRLIRIKTINLRNFAHDKHKSVDDHSYGGGAGMILRVDIIDRAIIYAQKQSGVSRPKTNIILLDPGGLPYTAKQASALSQKKHLVLVCGHYEGVDERVRSLVDSELSIGDFIVSGGELPAMLLVDSIVRLLPKALNNANSPLDESFDSTYLLEYPQYTRPLVYKRRRVPQILLSGNHQKIRQWRCEHSRLRTKMRRPDLLAMGTEVT